MSETRNDPDLEIRVRGALHRLADSHQPAPRAQPGDSADATAPRRRWLAAAASLLVVAGLAAVLAVSARDESTEPAVSSPPESGPATTSETRQGVPNVDGDAAIDPAQLRFPEQLPDDTAAIIDDPSLPPPQLATRSDPGVLSDPGSVGDRTNSVSIVVMDGPHLLMRGAIVDLPRGSVDLEPSGPFADIGVDGARYADEDQGAIVIPLGDGVRIVAPDDYFSFGGGGPHIDPNVLIDIAGAIGTRPLDEVDDLPGFFVFNGTIDGESLEPGFFADGTVTVVHGSRREPAVTLHRLPEPPTALELIALVQALTRGTVESPTVGDVTFVAGPVGYVELVSPVDLLIVAAPGAAGGVIDDVVFVPLEELE